MSNKYSPYIIFILLFIVYSGGTIARNMTWKDDMVLWQDVVIKSPNIPDGHYNLGILYYNKEQLDLAIAELKMAIKIYPDYTDAHYNLGATYQSKGLLSEAITEYEKVLTLEPDSADAYYNLGIIFMQSNSFDKAVSTFQEALRIKPNYSEAIEGLNKVSHLKQLQR